MNTNANNNPIDAKIHTVSSRACLLSFIPKRNTDRIDLSEVLKSMSHFLAQNKELEIVYDFSREKNVIKAVYQDECPNCMDANKVLEKMRDMQCGVLIIPSFRAFAYNPFDCRAIMDTLIDAGIRVISPYDRFDTKPIYERVTAETSEIFRELREALRSAISQCVVNDVDEFIDYVDKTRNIYKTSPFVIAFGEKAIQIPYSEDICTEIFDFLCLLDENYLCPELYEDDECDDEDDEYDDIPNYEHEPLVERDFEG